MVMQGSSRHLPVPDDGPVSSSVLYSQGAWPVKT